MKHAIFVLFIIILAGVLSGCNDSGESGHPNADIPPVVEPVGSPSTPSQPEWVIVDAVDAKVTYELQVEGVRVDMSTNIDEITMHNINQYVDTLQGRRMSILDASGVEVAYSSTVDRKGVRDGFFNMYTKRNLNNEFAKARMVKSGSKIIIAFRSYECEVNDFANDQYLSCRDSNNEIKGHLSTEGVIKFYEIVESDKDEAIKTDWIHFLHTYFVSY